MNTERKIAVLLIALVAHFAHANPVDLAIAVDPTRYELDPGQADEHLGNAQEDAQLIDDDFVATSVLASAKAVSAFTNQARGANDLNPLRLDSGLSSVAQRFAEDMHRRGYFSHTSPEGSTMQSRLRQGGVSFGWAGENIAKGQRDAREVVSGWMKSPGHRSNILHPRYLRLGVGQAGNVWVQVFSD